MKRNVLPLLFALVVTTAPLLAQTEKGNGILGGGASAGYSYNRTESGSSAPFVSPALTLTAGKFVADN